MNVNSNAEQITLIAYLGQTLITISGYIFNPMIKAKGSTSYTRFIEKLAA